MVRIWYLGLWKKGYQKKKVLHSLSVLHDLGYVRSVKTVSDTPHRLQVQDFVFDKYGRVHMPDYEDLVKRVAIQIQKHGSRRSEELATTLDADDMIVEYILCWMQSEGYIRLYEETGPGKTVDEIYPGLDSITEE